MFAKYFYYYKYLNYIERLCNKHKIRGELKDLFLYFNQSKKKDFSEIRDSLLRRTLEYAQNNTDYYRDLFEVENVDVQDLSSFENIPCLTKDLIERHREKIESRTINIRHVHQMNTGGSTGKPLSFPISYNYDPEHQEMAYRSFGYKKVDRIVCVDGTEIDKENLRKNIYWKTVSGSSLPYGKTAYSALYLNEKTLRYYTDQLNMEKPAIIRGYPSAINHIAVYILENRIDINFDLKMVQLTAEFINQEQVDNIQKAFNCRVGLEYGHSECAVFAHTFDNTYNYYCSPLYGYTEILGKDGNHVEIGEIGDVVVTGFYNKAMPFIRYKTEDLALYSGTENGIVKLGKIYGRNQDFLYDINGQKVFLIGLIYGGHHLFLNKIKKWQIIQDEYGYIKINVIKGTLFSSNESDEIQNLFNRNGITSRINYVNEISLTERGKNKFVIQRADM